MVPDTADESTEDASEIDQPPPRSDGGEPNEAGRDSSKRRSAGGDEPGFDEAALYRVVRAATKDALLDVIGTLLLVGVAFVLVAAGGQAVIGATSATAGAVGGALVLVGLYIAAATLELIPPIREWV